MFFFIFHPDFTVLHVISHKVCFARNNLNKFLIFLNQPYNRVDRLVFNANYFVRNYDSGNYYIARRVFTTCQHTFVK